MKMQSLIKTIVVILSLFYGSLAVVGGRFIVFCFRSMTDRKPDSSPLQGYTLEDVYFQSSDHLTLHGWFIKSPHNPTRRTLIVLAGWLCTRERVIEYLKLFADAGFHVLTYDQRSHGASDKAMITYGPAEGRDLLAAVQYLRTRSDVNLDKLGASGLSLGGSAIIHACAGEDIFKAVAFEGPYACSVDVVRNILEQRMNYYFALTVEWALRAGVQLWSWGRMDYAYPAVAVAQIRSTPLMIIWGENDDVVPPHSARRFIDSAPSHKEVWITPEGGHTNAYDHYPQEYVQRVVGFFERHLQ